jgi:hypothetical protein
MISVIGGTGRLGMGLAMRLAKAGEEVAIGSRSPGKAAKAVEKIRAAIPEARLHAMTNRESAEKSQVIFLAVPYSAQRQILTSIADYLQGKVLVNVVNPFKRVDGDFIGEDIKHGSAAEEAQALVPKAKVVSAFKNISHEIFTRIDEPIRCDTVVCSDHEEAKRTVMALADKIGVRPIDGGALKVSRYLEAVTVLLLNLNKRHGGNACLRIEFHS